MFGEVQDEGWSAAKDGALSGGVCSGSYFNIRVADTLSMFWCTGAVIQAKIDLFHCRYFDW